MSTKSWPVHKLLRWSGNLKRTPFGVTLTSAVWGALWGSVLLAYFGLLFVALVIAAWPNLQVATPGTLRAVLALVFFGLFLCGIYWFHIEPWLIQRRVDRQERK